MRSATIIEFVNRLAARKSLEQLCFMIHEGPADTTAFWQCLGKLRGLRVLKMGVYFADRELADGIEFLVGSLPRIENVEIRRYVHEDFRMQTYSRLDALCQQKNIAVDVAVNTQRINAEDLPRFSMRRYMLTIRFGRRD